MDFAKSYFGKNEPLTSWTLLSPVFFQISADLEKHGGQKCSTGQRFIFTEVTFYKIHILVSDLYIYSELLVSWAYRGNLLAAKHLQFQKWFYPIMLSPPSFFQFPSLHHANNRCLTIKQRSKVLLPTYSTPLRNKLLCQLFRALR